MDSAQPPAPFDARRILLSTALWGGLTTVVVVMIGGFNPLFRGNQTTKLLFGLADAGSGDLGRDWMANTKDPLLAFSWVVELTERFLDVRLFHAYQFVLVGVAVYSLVSIADHLFGLRRSPLVFFGFSAVYALTYSSVWPWSVRSSLHDGVAIQDLALAEFLPNGFGAFLLLSILLFLRGHPHQAVISLAVACTFHTGYLTAGAAVTAAYLVADYREHRDLRRMARIGGLALVLVLPVVIHFVAATQDATAAQVAEMNRIVAQLRIPHHTQVSEWWDGSALFKTGLVAGAAFVTRKTPLCLVLVAGLLLAAVPTVAVAIRPSDQIAVLQLWRVSVFLVPLSSAVLLGWAVAAIASASTPRALGRPAVVVPVLTTLLLVGLVSGWREIGSVRDGEQDRPEFALMDHVADSAGAGELYLVPPKDWDLFPFRLETGRPIYVNWKSHPWNATEFEEWDLRIRRAERFYAAADRCGELAGFHDITHVVMPAADELVCDGATELYGNSRYRLYRLET